MLKKLNNFFKKILNKLDENLKTMLSGMGWLFSGQIVTRLINITYGILLARLIGKNQFGELAIIFSVITMFSQVAGFGMAVTTTRHVALLKNNDPKRTGRCLSFCLILSFSVSVLMSLVCAFSSKFIAINLYGQEELTTPLLLSSFFLMSSVFIKPLEGALSGFENFKAIVNINILQVTSLFIIGLPLSYFYNIAGAVTALALSWTAACIYASRCVFLECISAKIKLTFKGIKNEVRIIWVYGIPNLLTSAVVGPSIVLSQAIVANVSGGVAGLGGYQAAMSWRRAVLFAPQAVRRVTLPLLAKMKGDKNKSEFKKILFINLFINGGVASCIALVLIVSSPFIISLYGKDFSNDWDLIIILVVSGVFQTLNDVVTQVGAALEKMWWNFGIHVIWATTMFLGAKYAVPIWGVRGYAWVFSIVTFNHFILNTIAAFYFYKNDKF